MQQIRIVEGTYTEYLCLFGEYRTAYADLCARSASASGSLYLMLDTDGPCGYLCQADEGDTDRIAYIFIVPHRRGTGVAKLLLRHALERTGKELWINLAEGADTFPQVHALITGAGFFPANTSMIYRSGIEHDLSYWERFMEEKGNAFNRLIARMGFTAYSFREAPQEFVDALYNSSHNDYGNLLDVRPFFDDAGRAMDRDMSFLLVHTGSEGRRLAAYSLVVRPDARSAVFEHMSIAEGFQNTGCVFLAIARSMEVFRRKGCSRAAYTVYEDNKKANAFCRRIFARVTGASQRTYHYMLRRKNIDAIGTEGI